MRRLILFLTVIAIASVAATPVAAQVGRAELRGRVTDQQGGALPGVTVVITDQNSGTFREILTSADGTFFAAQLLPGVFTITAQLSGFRSFERTDFELGVGRTLDLDIELQIGNLQETVTVSGDSPLVDLTSAEVGGTVDAGELTDLPTGNRSYFAAVALLPGIQFSPSSSLGNDTMVANGQTTGGNSVGLDGATNNDDVSGTGAGGQVRVPIESVSEFQVLTNQFDAEFGRVRGAIINSITKQGTNQFTGAGYNYFSSDAMTSEDFFVRNSDTLTKPATSKKEFGGIIGGPIVRDKAHFFFSAERTLVDPSRSREFPTRPDLNFTLSENWKSLNTLIRVDNQINANNSWAFRWLREGAPQFSLIGNRTATENALEDETDNDQIFVGTYTNVIGSDKVNTFGATVTSESFWRGNPCWRDAGEIRGGQRGCPPEWNYRSGIQDNQYASSNGRDDENFQLRNTFSWFVPDMGGDHDLKFGGAFHRTRITRGIESNLAGSFEFNTDLVFDPTNPATFPDRLSVQVGNVMGQTFEIVMHTYEFFAQDKWQVNDRLTIGLGVRYDLELFDSGVTDNPLFPNGGDPRDFNNFSPRTSLAYDVEGDGRSVVRAGYGIFYDKTTIDGTDNPLEFPKFTDSFTQFFPLNSADPGPANGMLPTNPFLLNWATGTTCPANPGGACPVVDFAGLDAIFPPGTQLRNLGDVYFNSPNQKQPWMHQFTFGYERELTPTLSVSADYIRTMGRDMLARVRYNMSRRLGTGRTDPIVFDDVYNALGADFADFNNDVIVQESVGQTNYDALNLQVEKRYSDRWGARLAYALGHSRGNTFQQWQTISTQVGADLNLDEFQQPAQTDRRHILTLSGRTELPGGVTASSVLRYMSGSPFSIVDDRVDPNQNGILDDPVAPGSYSGTGANAITVVNDGGYGGARGPDFLQLDVRLGYRARPYQDHTLDIFFDIFNLTDRANFNNPNGDMRSGNFLNLISLRGGSGFPRQAQFGVRYGF